MAGEKIHSVLSLLAAATLGATLTPTQERRLAHILVCPERLPDDAARIRNTQAFMTLYARFAPQSRAGTRMALRDRVLTAKRCRDPRPLQHSFPES